MSKNVSIKKPKIRTKLFQLRAEYAAKTGNKITQSQLGELVGLTQEQISNMENNKRESYDLALVSRILQILGKPKDAWHEFFEVVEDSSDTEGEEMPYPVTTGQGVFSTPLS